MQFERKRKRQDVAAGSHSSLEDNEGSRQPLTMVLASGAIQEKPWCISKELIDGCDSGDLLLVCKDNKAVCCHSQMLAFCSNVLKDMLEGTDLCKGCTADNPARIHVDDDVAEHWLYALMFMYPLVQAPPAPDLGTAMALALLGHKYNIPRVTIVWEQFVDKVSHVNPGVGHFTWVITDWEDEKDETTINSESFEAGGFNWTLTMYPNGDNHDEEEGAAPSHMGVFLFLNTNEDDATEGPTVSFTGTIVSQSQPTVANVSQNMGSTLFSREEDSGYGWPKFMPLDVLEDPEKGYVKDNTLEFQVVIQVHSPLPNLNGEHVLSSMPEEEGYVFKWLELARTIKDVELEEKCISFLGHNAFRAMVHPKFRQDLRDCMPLLQPEQVVQLIRSARNHC